MLHGFAQKQKNLDLDWLGCAVGDCGDWCWGGAAGAHNDIDPNRIAKVQRGDVLRSVVATGKIQPITKVEVKARHPASSPSSTPTSITRVIKGSLWRNSISRRLKLRWMLSGRSSPAAEANVATYEANIEQDKVNAAAPDLPMYKATLDRNQQLSKEGMVSRQALDDANQDYLAALTRRDSSKAQIGVDTAKLKQAQAQVRPEPGQPQAA